jgi:hypothetical protein
MSNDVIEAAQFYIRVCTEHRLLFPLRNILVVSSGFASADDGDRFVSDVENAIEGYRNGDDIDGLDDTLRDDFGRL